MLKFNQLSYWEKETYLNKVDYLVIGSGIVGLSTAIHLKKKHPNKKVLVLERGYLPTGASTKNAGFACIGSASELLNDLQTTSESEVFDTVNKRWQGLQYLRSMLGDENIHYQELGSHELFSIRERNEFKESMDQLPYLNQKLEEITGIQSAYMEAANIITKSNFEGFSGAISNKAEGQINTGMMMERLLRLAYSLDVKVLNTITAEKIENQSVYTNHGKISFEKLAVCTNGLAAQLLTNFDITPARAQIIITSPIANLKIKGIFHFDKGYYYFRNVGKRVLFGGGRNLNFKAEETDELNTSDQIINHLSHLLESQLLPYSSFSVEQYWAGTMGIGKTKSPVLKQIDDNIFCGVRLGGMGVAIGSLIGKELAEKMGR